MHLFPFSCSSPSQNQGNLFFELSR
jgi:hypothetical protein